MAEIVSKTKEEKKKQKDALINKILFVPIMIFLTIIPLIVRVVQVQVTDPIVASIYGTSQDDVFSKCKASVMLLVAIAMLIILFLCWDKAKMKKDKWMGIYFISSLVFLIFSLISTFASDYKDLAWWGAPDRAEGMVTIGCYILAMLFTVYAFEKFENYYYIVIGLAIVVVINTFLGIFQYMGNDLLANTSFGRMLIMSAEQRAIFKGADTLYERGNMYGTMFHYNYIGSFTAMVVPFFGVLTILLKSKKEKLVCGVLTLISIVLLIGSTSRSGLVGVAGVIIVGCIFFAKYIVKRWKISLPLFVAAIAIVIGANAVAGGTIFKRVPKLIEDVQGLFSPAERTGDYKDEIYVRNIETEGNTATIEVQGDKLILNADTDKMAFTDASGASIEFTADESGIYTTTDSRFNELSFLIEDLHYSTGKCVRFIYSENSLVNFKIADNTVSIIDYVTEEPMTIEDAEHIGFEGKEKIGSARGYIWSRTFPMLKNHILVGSGPDTYALVFPQNDLYAKLWAYHFNVTVDKPHNLYLQIAVNEGVIALLAFLVLVGTYLVQSFKLYGLKGIYTKTQAMGIATTLAIVGYLTAGFFNDSIVSVAPIFWILLGVGLSVNYLNQKAQ